MLDPVLIKLFLVILFYKYRAPPLRPRPADLAYLIVPLSPFDRCQKTFSPVLARARSPQEIVIVPLVFVRITPSICDFGVQFLHFLAPVLELLPPSICDFGVQFLHFLAPEAPPKHHRMGRLPAPSRPPCLLGAAPPDPMHHPLLQVQGPSHGQATSRHHQSTTQTGVCGGRSLPRKIRKLEKIQKYE